jgi:hypothetical protein
MREKRKGKRKVNTKKELIYFSIYYKIGAGV